MFKKKPTIKPLSPLKSSDRRRTADQIISDFAIEVPVDASADPEDKTAAAAGLTALRKSLLPENAQSARFTTTAGPDLKQVSGTIYVGSHEGTGNEQRILWVKVWDKMYPTVYTLWYNPRIVPLLYTPLFVVEKLQGGADLMTPGLQRGPPFPKRATKGAIVAIASLEAPTVPMAVGTCEIDVSALEKTQGMKGHAVSTFHWAGDELWSWSSTSKPGSNPPAIIEGWDDEKEDEANLAERTGALDLDAEEEEGGIALDAGPTERSQAELAQGVEGEDAQANKDFIDVIDDKELTTKEIDEAFHNAFLYGVRQHMNENKNHPSYGLDFPLSQSLVMSQLVQPFLPTYTPARTASLQIKKTSWKNLKKFVKSLDKQKMVRCKDRDGHEVVILDIDFKDRQIEQFVPYRLPKKDAPTASASGKSGAPSSNESSVGQKLKLVSLLRPKEKLAPIFHASKADPRGMYTPAELKQILIAYVEAENLVNAKNRRLININPQLADALLGSSAADNAALSSGTMPRDALAERMVAATSPFHAILRNDADIADTKPKAGAPPKITITLETRSGNKMVSKVHGLEPYHIAPQPLADELRKTCAGSTSVDKLQGSSPKNPIMEVMVQGPQKDAILKALEKRGVRPNWVDVVDKTKGKKK
ncbi:RNA binding protein-like protein Ligatin/Tma64 [Dothidotthia symphoricarpi CBS 119687]|uniref:RNA binding protein-like protein Ligatin/Tma64 n=1 Tax=Dothidotthia symphoricarpi CBS 119687 TaxID=1392245 RepID=A0A6A6ADE9_9PLEO|nr:RNA binding protein-like protein Ligatin/Tma64 [Dothidotthia symphoricarpi CBS 119687]KAF2128958.1 RNA binding protein-like protein Ligatin/Tma64 [Dothidotthia symphoricarpi CBS 119687]